MLNSPLVNAKKSGCSTGETDASRHLTDEIFSFFTAVQKMPGQSEQLYCCADILSDKIVCRYYDFNRPCTGEIKQFTAKHMPRGTILLSSEKANGIQLFRAVACSTPETVKNCIAAWNAGEQNGITVTVRTECHLQFKINFNQNRSI